MAAKGWSLRALLRRPAKLAPSSDPQSPPVQTHLFLVFLFASTFFPHPILILDSSDPDSISVRTANGLDLDLSRFKIGVVLLVLVAGTSNWSSCPTNMLWIIRSHEPCVAPDAINLELWIM